MDRVLATYLLESYHPLERAAEVLAGEQSSGTFVAVPGESKELQRRHRATVESIEPLPFKAAPSLPGASMPQNNGSTSGSSSRVNAGVVTVSFPLENFGPSLPNLLAAVAGNLYELRELAGVRLLDVVLPPAFAQRYAGPAFGVAGTRQLMSVPQGILVGTIIKPSVGLTPDELRPIIRELVEAEIDFIKDDELIADPPYSPLAERVRVTMEEIERGAQRTGKKTMYAFNITDDIENLERNYEIVARAGGTCVMVCINLIGVGGVSYLRRFCALPIHGHRAMIGALMRHPALGIDFQAYQKFARLAGVDHLHTSGMNNKFYETNAEVRASIEAVRTPLFGGYETLPVLSSGQWAGSAHPTYAALGTTDLLMLAGGGVHAHPGGRAAGVRSLRQAWDAATSGISLADHAHAHRELAQAIAHFSGC
jgi:ribulose-bisphosphate carboxylase large chain